MAPVQKTTANGSGFGQQDQQPSILDLPRIDALHRLRASFEETVKGFTRDLEDTEANIDLSTWIKRTYGKTPSVAKLDDLKSILELYLARSDSIGGSSRSVTRALESIENCKTQVAQELALYQSTIQQVEARLGMNFAYKKHYVACLIQHLGVLIAYENIAAGTIDDYTQTSRMLDLDRVLTRKKDPIRDETSTGSGQ